MRSIRAGKASRVAAGVACLLALSACSGRSTASSDEGGNTAAASSTGITADSVTVGNVSALSGPIPGLFQGAPNGVEAYFAMVNAAGGINGRQLKLVSEDDALNCNQNNTATKELVGKVFAFVNNYSVFDGCGATVLADHPEVADVSEGLDTKVLALQTHYAPQPAPPGARTGAFKYYKDTYGVGTVGTLYGQGAAEVKWNEQKAALESVGYKVGYARGVGTTESNFTSDIIRMRDAGVDFLYLTDIPARYTAQFLQQAKQQNWKPKVTVSGVAYDAAFFKLLGDPSVADGLLFDQPFAMFLGEDKDSVPAVADFLTWMKKTKPDFQPDLFSMYGWVSGQLFAQALEKAGKNPTRADVVDALSKFGEFDADGMIAKSDVGTQKPTECWLLGQVKDGKYARVLPEGKGYTCDPGGYFLVDGS